MLKVFADKRNGQTDATKTIHLDLLTRGHKKHLGKVSEN